MVGAENCKIDFHPCGLLPGCCLFRSKRKLAVEVMVREFANGDLLLVIAGGQSHIGALGLGLPRPSCSQQGETRAAKSVIALPEHREDEMLREMIDIVVAATGRRVAAVAGVHFDGLTKNQLGGLRRDWKVLARAIGAYWAGCREDNGHE